jgi:hypothetical protein
VVLPPYLLPLKSLGYDTWGALLVNINTTVHLKMGTLKRTIWQLWAAKVM